MRHPLLLLALLLYTSMTHAAEPTTPMAFRGMGAASCAEFAEAYKQSPGQTELAFFSWAQGFMSGLNGAALKDGSAIRDLATKPYDSQTRDVRNYCSENPLKDYVSAVISLYKSLKIIPQ